MNVKKFYSACRFRSYFQSDSNICSRSIRMILHRFNYKGDHITLKEAKRILAEQEPSVFSPK